MIPNLQLLRAFAAINVVFYHIIGTEITYGYPPLQFLNTLEVLRDIGVHIFFVISFLHLILYFILLGKFLYQRGFRAVSM